MLLTTSKRRHRRSSWMCHAGHMPWNSPVIIHSVIELCSYFHLSHCLLWPAFASDIYYPAVFFRETDYIAIIHRLYDCMFTRLDMYLCDFLSFVSSESSICYSDLYLFPTLHHFRSLIRKRHEDHLRRFPHRSFPQLNRPSNLPFINVSLGSYFSIQLAQRQLAYNTA